MDKASYDENAITVLEGIDAIRKRPGMYIGGTGPDGLHHLLWEIVDNATDEAQNGYCHSISVTLHADGSSLTVEDDGRGIPVGVQKQTGKSALEVIFTTLHSGSKFGGDSYETSGGLHGVGASAVNALSARLEARVRREGALWGLDFRKGKVKGPVERIEDAKGTGTAITFAPDPEIFEDTTFDPDRILRSLEIKAFLHKGLRIRFVDEGRGTDVTLKHDGGLSDYLQVVLDRSGSKRILAPTFAVSRGVEGVILDLAVAWTDSPRE